MTQNSVSAIQSSPWTGLGTQTYNVLTTGTYTCQVYCNIQWDASNTTALLANPSSMKTQTVVTVADSSGSLNNTYWEYHNAGDTTGYYVWYNVNSAGTDPAIAGLTGTQVALATSDANTVVATKTAAAINAVTGNSTGGNGTVTATVSGHTITLADTQPGTSTSAVDTGTTGFTFAVTAAGSYGALQSGLRLQILNNGTVVQTVGNPTQTQPSLYLTQTMACTAGTLITMVAASTAQVDQTPNAIHGIMNVFSGPL